MVALNSQQYKIWLGYAFERFCRRYDYIIAIILGFGAVKYSSGPFYNRTTTKSEPGFQMDLVFKRSDKVITVCEIKDLQQPAKKKICNEMEKKLENFPFDQKYTLQKVLISASRAEKSLIDEHYFDAIITLEDLINPHNW